MVVGTAISRKDKQETETKQRCNEAARGPYSAVDGVGEVTLPLFTAGGKFFVKGDSHPKFVNLAKR